MTRKNNTRHPLLHEQFGNTLIDSSCPWDCVCGVGVWVVCVCVCAMGVVCCVSVLGLRLSRVGFCGLCLPGLVSRRHQCRRPSSLSSCRCCVVSLCSVQHALSGAHTSMEQ